MIPFNHLGWLFDRFGKAAYPAVVVDDLCEAMGGIRAGGSVLDLGAGTGTVGNYAHACREDLHYTAADPADGMLRYVPEHAEKVRAHAEALPFETGRFDAVTAGEALHHFRAPDEAFAEIARVLKPGGVLFIYEFDPSTRPGRLLRLAERLLGEPGHFYPPDLLADILSEHGFDPIVRRHGWRYTLSAVLNGKREND